MRFSSGTFDAALPCGRLFVMILLLGASGFLGRAFARELRRRGYVFIPLVRRAFDYGQMSLLLQYVRKTTPQLVINAAGYSGRPNVDECEHEPTRTFQANTILPQIVARVCLATNTPWAHVSSGGIYSGARVIEAGRVRIVRDLNQPEIRELYDTHPERFLGFTELDPPNFTFQKGPCGFYAGTKALAEESLQSLGAGYIWRPRIPFGEVDEPCNLLSKLQSYARIYDHVTSLSHVDDCVRACLDLWEQHAPFGIYNVTNPGAVTTREVVEMIQRFLKLDRHFEYWADEEEFYTQGALAPRSSCILDVSKLLSLGIKIRPVKEALAAALKEWRPASPPASHSDPVLLPLGRAGNPVADRFVHL